LCGVDSPLIAEIAETRLAVFFLSHFTVSRLFKYERQGSDSYFIVYFHMKEMLMVLRHISNYTNI